MKPGLKLYFTFIIVCIVTLWAWSVSPWIAIFLLAALLYGPILFRRELQVLSQHEEKGA